MSASRPFVRTIGVLLVKNRYPSPTAVSRTRTSRLAFSRSFRLSGPIFNSHPRNTSPSSPSEPPEGRTREDEGSLIFTRTSLYKLILPLKLPSSDGKAASSSELAKPDVDRDELGDDTDKASKGTESAGESSVDNSLDKPKRGDHYTTSSESNHQFDSTQNIVLLLHPGQPLSYIANLVRAEEAYIEPIKRSEDFGERSADPTGQPPITFYTLPNNGQRWSPATGIGDFLREAAREGNFTIYIGNQRIRINVPSFEERTRFLRASLHAKTAHIERLAILKGECDRMARKAAQRMAFAGAGVLCAWWVIVGVLTFSTPLGWDVMEPVTYLTGHGMLIWGYLWFLWHNREVSYSTVLTESTSRRQHKLYSERGFDTEAYNELIVEAKDLRRAIKRVAWDYGRDWDQGDTKEGSKFPTAVNAIRKEEAKDRKAKRTLDDEEHEEDDVLAQGDEDNNGKTER